MSLPYRDTYLPLNLENEKVEIIDNPEEPTLHSTHRRAGRCGGGDPHRRKKRRVGHFLAIFVLSTVALWKYTGLIRHLGRFLLSEGTENALGNSSCSQATSSAGNPLQAFNWTALTPSAKLAWVDCYKRFKCSRLEVPLNYAEPDGDKAAVALIKFPSSIPPGKEGYKGPILFNPGGPGGSGVAIAFGLADQFRAIIGDGFDLIGFDPRGVGFTTPGIDPWTSKLEGMMLIAQSMLTLNHSQSALPKLVGTVNIAGNIVEARQEKVAQHVSTPIVARDMLSIVKAHGLDKLQYWGFSYGTVLGATFAAMFPNNVGRLIIDGVVDSTDYYKAYWSNNLRDTDTELNLLYEACSRAGPKSCPMYDKDSKSIATRVDNVLGSLLVNPISFYNNETGEYGIIDYAAVKHVIFATLYSPYADGKTLIEGLAGLETGNPEPMFNFLKIRSPITKDDLMCDCPKVPPVPFAGGPEITIAIACGESDSVKNDIDELREFYNELGKTSSFADVWGMHAACAGWTIRTKEKFSGSFEQNTSHPLLLIGNTADPVTPLWNAHKMSEGFKDSVVLTQNSSGHCSIAAASLCTTKAVRAYFQDGTLPEKGTVCETVSDPFSTEMSISMDTLSEEDSILLQASKEMEDVHHLHIPRFF